MAYPTYDQLYGSEFVPESSIVVEQTPYGEFETRTTFGARRPGTFNLIHMLTSAQWTTLKSNYTTNVAAQQSFTWQEDSTGWTVQWAGPPQAERLASDLYRVTASLRVVIDYGSLITEQDNAEDLLLLENGDEILTEGAS